MPNKTSYYRRTWVDEGELVNLHITSSVIRSTEGDGIEIAPCNSFDVTLETVLVELPSKRVLDITNQLNAKDRAYFRDFCDTDKLTENDII